LARWSSLPPDVTRGHSNERRLGPLGASGAKAGTRPTAFETCADFGAHSLRAGFLTSAARRGASVFKMRDVSRHKSMDVLQAYVRDADLFPGSCGGWAAVGKGRGKSHQ
jgi:hypothetical protein